ncbi:unnamed protein product, partial [Polarella glacialis]
AVPVRTLVPIRLLAMGHPALGNPALGIVRARFALWYLWAGLQSAKGVRFPVAWCSRPVPFSSATRSCPAGFSSNEKLQRRDELFVRRVPSLHQRCLMDMVLIVCLAVVQWAFRY